MLLSFVVGLALGVVLGALGLVYSVLRLVSHKHDRALDAQQRERERTEGYLRAQHALDGESEADRTRAVVGATKATLQLGGKAKTRRAGWVRLEGEKAQLQCGPTTR